MLVSAFLIVISAAYELTSWSANTGGAAVQPIDCSPAAQMHVVLACIQKPLLELIVLVYMYLL